MSNEEIVKKIKDGSADLTALYERLYKQNKTLIRDVCKKFTKYAEMDDLQQQAYFGLVEAVTHYETSKNVLFMSFALYWIERELWEYVQKNCLLFRVPQHISGEKIPAYNRYIQQFTKEHDRQPTDQEIMAALHIRKDTLRTIQQTIRGVTSLDTPLKTQVDGDTVTLADTIKADLSVEDDTVDKMYSDYEKQALWGIVDAYTSDRESEVLRMVFIENVPYREIGERLNVSKQRVEQLRKKGLKRLQEGKARRELLEKLEVCEADLYRGGIGRYRSKRFTSVTEHLAIKESEIMDGFALKKQA